MNIDQELAEKVTILTGDPVIACIAEMRIDSGGTNEMVEWLRLRRPWCLPRDCEGGAERKLATLFPHDGTEPQGEGWRCLTDNERLVELAGRKCYDSFGLKAGKKTNAEYIANTQQGDVPHGSIMYHAKMSFFIAGISRRVSHELIRHYVGADRDEEGSPSQESTRYVAQRGVYVCPIRMIGAVEWFRKQMQTNYDSYCSYVRGEIIEYALAHDGKEPQGMDRKRIYEAASALLSHSAETSFVWTTNPIALAKMFKERDHEAADLEYLRFAKGWKKLCVSRWPNLFPQPWMKL